MESTANHINSLVEDQENTQAMLNLQNSLISRCPRIIEPCRKLIREGILQKVTRRNETVRRYCALMSDIFMYCRVCRDRAPGSVVDSSLECCCIFPLKKCKVVETLRGTFRIKCQDDEIILQTNDEALAKEWVNAIKQAIEMHIEYRRTLRKESSRRVPLRKKKDLRNMAAHARDDEQQPLRYENVVKMLEDNNGSESSSDEGNMMMQLRCFQGRRPRWLRKRKATGVTRGNEEEPMAGSSGVLSAKRTKRSAFDQENIMPQNSSTPLAMDDNQEEMSEEAHEMKKRTVRFSDIKPVPFKYDDDQEYLNSKFLERTTTRQTIVKDSLTKRIWNFINGWF